MNSLLLLLFICALIWAKDDTTLMPSKMHAEQILSEISFMGTTDSAAMPYPTVREDTLGGNITEARRRADTLSGSINGYTQKLVNIVSSDQKIRVFGWGEYQVAGRCICCDNNMKSADCIMVQTTIRTNRLRIKQITDGNIEADTGNKATYFGDIYERDDPTKPVALLMAHITLSRQRDIYRIIVYGVADSLKKKNVIFNCQLGYIDQFGRLQWTQKVQNSGNKDHIIFEPQKPIFTSEIFLKIKDGRNRITEVAIFAKDETE